MKNTIEVKTMFPISLQQPTVPPIVKAIPQEVTETLEMLGMDLLEFQ